MDFCSDWLTGGALHCDSGQQPYDDRHIMVVAMKGRGFHPHCDWWRIVQVAFIRDQLEENPRETNSSNGRRYNFRQLSKFIRWCQLSKVETCRLCCTHC